jgi:hypothetical protein
MPNIDQRSLRDLLVKGGYSKSFIPALSARDADDRPPGADLLIA